MSWDFPHIHIRRARGVWSSSPAGSLLHPLVAVQDAFQKLCHEGFEEGIGGLGDHPMCIATQGPTGNGAHQGLLVAKTLDEVGDQLRQVGYHALHAAWAMERDDYCYFIVLFYRRHVLNSLICLWKAICILATLKIAHVCLDEHVWSLTLSNGPEHQDARLLDDPVRVEKQAFQEGKEMWQQVVTEHIGQHIQGCSRTLSYTQEKNLYKNIVFLKLLSRQHLSVKTTKHLGKFLLILRIYNLSLHTLTCLQWIWQCWTV